MKKYPLLPYSQLVWNLTRWMPMVYRFPMKFVWRGGAKEKERIEQAIQTAIWNHPVFSMRVDARGMHYEGQVSDRLHGPYMKVDIEERGEDLVIAVQIDRILGDGRSGQILLEDVQRAYAGLPLEPDDYWGYVARYEQQKSGMHYLNSKVWLEREFQDESVPVRPTIDRNWIRTIFPPKAGLYTDDFTSLREPIRHLVDEQHLTLDGVFSLCAGLAIAEYCGTEEAALTWAYEGRETQEEQRVFGSLHRDIPFCVRKSIIANRDSAIREARNQIRSGIAHSDYPYTLTAPYNMRWDDAVNVLNVKDIGDFLPTLDFPCLLDSMPRQKYAYAILDVEIHKKEESLQLVYRYSATHYREESIRKFAGLVRKYVEWLID